MNFIDIKEEKLKRNITVLTIGVLSGIVLSIFPYALELIHKALNNFNAINTIMAGSLFLLCLHFVLIIFDKITKLIFIHDNIKNLKNGITKIQKTSW